MRVGLDADQEARRDATATMLATECTPADVRAAWAGDTAVRRDRWERLAALGLTGVVVPAELGGFGGTDVDLVPLLEEAGYVALPEPVAEAATVAVLLAEAAPELAERWLPPLASGSAVATLGLPDDRYVLHADAADVVVVAGRDVLWVLEPGDAQTVAQPSVDGARRLFAVVPTGEAVPCPTAAIERAVDRAALCAAAQLLGLGRRCLDLAVDYARQRHQFGQPIGSYQALAHRMADDWTALALARPVVWRAAWSLSHGRLDASLHVSAAKAMAGDAATRAARTAVQVHGAMGYTFECDVQLYLKRTLALSAAHGDAVAHRRRLAHVLARRDIETVP